MSNSAAYTPLETLLLVQSLAKHGTETASFARVSELLRSNSFVRQSKSFDLARLAPDALKVLYDDLLSAEGSIETAGRGAGKDVGESGRGSSDSPKKRKLSSPPMAPLRESANHLQIMPQMIDRLYSRYREEAIREIRAEERRYDGLLRDIELLESGRWDNRGSEQSQTLIQEDNKSDTHQDAKAVDGLAHPAVPSARVNQTSDQIASDPSLGTQMPLASARSPFAASTKGSTYSRHYPATLNQSSSQAGVPSASRPPHSPSHLRTLTSHQTEDVPVLTSAAGGILDNAQNARKSRETATNPSTPSSVPAVVESPATSSISRGAPLFQVDEHSPFVPTDTSTPAAVRRAGEQSGSYFPRQTSGSPPDRAVTSLDRQNSQTLGSVGAQLRFQQSATHDSMPSLIQSLSDTTQRGEEQPLSRRTSVSTTAQTRSSSFARGRSRHRLPPINTSSSSTRWKRSNDDTLHRSPLSPSGFSPNSAVDATPDRETADEQHVVSEQKTTRGKNARETTADLQKRATRGVQKQQGKRPTRSRKKHQAGESPASSTRHASSPARTRSQSLASHADELSMDSGFVGIKKVKDEIPPSPAAFSAMEDSETGAESLVNTRSRRRGGTLKSNNDRGLVLPNLTRLNPKRKRSVGELSAERSPSFSAVGGKEDGPLGSGSGMNNKRQITCTRNFPRTSGPLMAEIGAHKYASIFAHPVREKDAPGYSDLIYQPQDLKSIRAAILAGGRAVTAATAAVAAAAATTTSTAVGTPTNDPVASPGPNPTASISTPGKPSGSLVIPASEDVVPPKGIVNSAQLEKEVMRMFANAVMFNPDPARGFGRGFSSSRLNSTSNFASVRDEQGTASLEPKSNAIDPAVSTSASASASVSYRVGPADTISSDDEGGAVVRDTREMFDVVEKTIAEWRAAESAADLASSAAAANRTPTAGMKGKTTAAIAAAAAARAQDDDEPDELAGDAVEESAGPAGKRRRK
ncbi:MAG: hypothetical protein M1825_001079 [Sarcosagium campestre]|nr:MAG: hypothetical protein M1825_001079 [Sarcosagium campestre]